MRELFGRFAPAPWYCRPVSRHSPQSSRCSRCRFNRNTPDQHQCREAHRRAPLLAAAPRQLAIVGDPRPVPRYARRQPHVLHGERHRELQSPALRARRPHAHRRPSARLRHLQSVPQTRRRARRRRDRAARHGARLHARRNLPMGSQRVALARFGRGNQRSLAQERQERRLAPDADGQDMGRGRRDPQGTLRAFLQAHHAADDRRRVRDVHERRRAQHGPALELSVAAAERGVSDPDEPVVRRHRRIAAARGRLRQGHEHHPRRAGANRRAAEARGPDHCGRRRHGASSST